MSGADNLATLNAIEKVLNKRWPESKIEPTLDRILALTDALGSPQFSYPTIHLKWQGLLSFLDVVLASLPHYWYNFLLQ